MKTVTVLGVRPQFIKASVVSKFRIFGDGNAAELIVRQLSEDIMN